MSQREKRLIKKVKELGSFLLEKDVLKIFSIIESPLLLSYIFSKGKYKKLIENNIFFHPFIFLISFS
jgi:hypothetical protein